MLLKNILTISTVLFLCSASEGKNIKEVGVLEFRDLYYLSKYEIIDKVDIKVKDKRIIIDIDSLESALKNNPVVKSFSISESRGRLIVTVAEIEPVFLLALKKGNEFIPFETDSKFNIISFGKVHIYSTPLVIIRASGLNGNMLSSRIKNIVLIIEELRNSSLAPLVREINQVEITEESKIKVILNGRKTVFHFRPTEDNFYKLNYSLGYFDRARHYPNHFEIADRSGIIKIKN